MINLQFFVSISWGAQPTLNSSIWFSIWWLMYQPAFIYCPYLIQSFWYLPYSWCKRCFSRYAQGFWMFGKKSWHEGLTYKLKSVGVSDVLLKLFQSISTNRFQKVLLNGQTSEWLPVKAGVSQGSILGPILFLIYINNLSENIESTVKLFADDTSLFSVVYNNNTSAEALNRDLQKTSEWVHKWKMLFNPDVSKHAQEVIFSRKQAKSVHPDIVCL